MDKKKVHLVSLLCAAALLIGTLAGCAEQTALRAALAADVPETSFLEYSVGKLDALPAFDPDDLDAFQADLRGGDLRSLDLQGGAEVLIHSDYNTQTLWPDALPEGFDPVHVMELGKDPGLGVRSLHERGYTGNGVSIAIIDLPLGTAHLEYKERVVYYEDSTDFGGATMHGCAVASLAVGESVGVAPEAKLYFFAPNWFNEKDELTFIGIAEAIDRIVEINKVLPKGERIRSVSIARGFTDDFEGYDEVIAAVRRAEDAGIFVITTSMDRDSGYRFYGLERDPLVDPNDIAGYTVPYWWKEDARREVVNAVGFPMGSRTYAGFTGADVYEFSVRGGYSWAVPYIIGLYAIAAQVKPDITPREFWDIALDTASQTRVEAEGFPYYLNIANPTAIVERLLLDE